MKTTLKRLLVAFLVICMVMTLLPTAAFAASANDDVYVATYVNGVYNRDVQVVSQFTGGNTLVVTAPATVDGYRFAGWTLSYAYLMDQPHAASEYAVTTATPVGNTVSFSISSTTLTNATRLRVVGASYVRDYTYSVDGGAEQTVTSGTAVTLPATVDDLGANERLIGWSDGTNMYVPGARVVIDGNKTFTRVIVDVSDDTNYVKFVSDDGLLYGYVQIENGRITTLGTPVKEGYDFAGWVSGGLTYDAGNEIINPNDTYTASWTAKTGFRVTYDAGGITDNTVYSYNDSFTVSNTIPTAAGKTFECWTTADGLMMLPGNTYTIKGNVALEAVWRNADYTVKFIDANGALYDTKTATAANGYSVTMPVYNGEAGYTYLWNYNGGTYDASLNTNTITVNGDTNITLTSTATYKHVYTTVVTNDGSNQQAAVSTANNNLTGSLVEVEVTVPDGYTLTDVVARGHDSGAGITCTKATVNGNVVTYTFKMPGEDVDLTIYLGQDDIVVTFVDYDNTLLGYAYAKAGETIDAGEFPTATRDGYTFSRWYVVGTGRTFDDATVVTGNITVKADYTGADHEIIRGAGSSEHVKSLIVETGRDDITNQDKDLMIAATVSVAAKTSDYVLITACAEYNYEVTGIAVRATDGSAVIVTPTLQQQETKADGLTYYTYGFTMPNKDLTVEVYTAPKDFNVSVTEVNGDGGTFRINGFNTTSLDVAQGEEVTIEISTEPGYTIKSVTGTYSDNYGNQALVGELNGNTYTFTMVAKDVNIVIEYEADAYNVVVSNSNTDSYKPAQEWNGAEWEYTNIESLQGTQTSKGLVRIVGVEDVLNRVDTPHYYIPGDGTFNVGDKVEFNVTEYTGYDLDTLTVTYDNGEQSCSVTEKDGSYFFIMPAGDVEISATFVEESYTVTKNSAAEAHGDVQINGLDEQRLTADYKDEISVTVTPEEGYYVADIHYVLANGDVLDFDKASYTGTAVVDAIDTEHGITFHMPASDVEVFVSYEKISYSIVTSVASGDETGTIVVDQPRTKGEQVEVVVTPEYGYVLDSLKIVNDSTGEDISFFTESIDQTYGATFKFTMPQSTVTITANFVKDAYTVYYYDYNNSVIKIESIKYDEYATLEADVVTVPYGYHFVGWASDDVRVPMVVEQKGGAYSNDTTDFQVYKATEIYAVYAKDQIDVVFNAADNGEVNVTKLNDDDRDMSAACVMEDVHYKDIVTFVPVPDEGYMIDTVTISTLDSNGDPKTIIYTVTDGVYKFTVPSTSKEDAAEGDDAYDITVDVTFKKVTYGFTVDSENIGTNGTVSINGNIVTEKAYEFDYLDEVVISATPDAGYYVSKITATVLNPDATDTQNPELGYSYTYVGTKPAVDVYGETQSIKFPMPASDVKYSVEYEKCDFSIDVATTNAANADYGTVAKDMDVAQLDDEVTLTVTEKYGYDLKTLVVTTDAGQYFLDLSDFVKVENDDGTATITTTFVMPAKPVVVTAEYCEEIYRVIKDASSELDGVISMNGTLYDEVSYSYDFDESVTVNVDAKDGYYVTEIKAVGVKSDTEYDKYENTVTPVDTQDAVRSVSFNMPAENVMIYVTYDRIDYSITTHDVADQGTLSAQDYASFGDVVQVTITELEGYDLDTVTVTYGNDPDQTCQAQFISKTENADGVTADVVYAFVMPAEKVDVYATFVEENYKVSVVSANEGGSYTIGESNDSAVIFDAGDSVTVTAIPDDGYYVASITGVLKDADAVDTVTANNYTGAMASTGSKSVTFTMPASDVDFTIVFAKIDYTITTVTSSFNGAGRGTVTTDPLNTASVGAKVTITADPNDGYRFKEISVTDAEGNLVPVSFVSVDLQHVTTYSFTMPASDVTVNTVFEVKSSANFIDVRTDHWFFNAVNYTVDRGYFYGVTDDLFAPFMNITREMFVTVLGKMAHIDTSSYDGTSTTFTDVKGDAYYAPYVAWASENGIIVGYDSTTFGVGDNITREQMFVMLYNYCDFMGCDMSVPQHGFMNRYTDKDNISPWAFDALEWAVSNGIALGMTPNTINPKDTATRAQAAQMIMNLCDKILQA